MSTLFFCSNRGAVFVLTFCYRIGNKTFCIAKASFFLVISLVKTYLLHYGYEETLHAFDLATNSTVPPIARADGTDVQDTLYALHERKFLRQVLNYTAILPFFFSLSQIKSKLHWYDIFFFDIVLVHTLVGKAYREG